VKKKRGIEGKGKEKEKKRERYKDRAQLDSLEA
jgi:hypothetical protein